MDLDPVLCNLVKEKIGTFDRDDILEAVRLTGSFPAPGAAPADVVAQVIHDVAQHAESLADWPLCVSLYLRVLEYTVDSPRIPIGAWYRLGICQEHSGALREAMASFRQALSLGEAWPHVTALARMHLAELLMAAEEFEEAASILTDLLRALPYPEISTEQVQLSLARCHLRLGSFEGARRQLEALCRASPPTEAAAEALRLLADIHEASGDTDSAASCYQRIIQSDAAEIPLKLAAAHRLSALRRSS